MNDKTKLKLLKKTEESTKQKHDIQKPVLINSEEYFESKVSNEKYLRDFYQSYRFYEELFKDFSSNRLLLLFRSIDDLIMGLIQFNYEKEIVKNEKIPLKDILKSNKEFISKMKIELEKFKNNPDKSYIDGVYFSQIEQVLIENSSNSIEACIYKHEVVDRIEKANKKFNSVLFKLLSDKGMSLGTNKPSKAKNNNINTLLAKIYYEVLTNDNLNKEFIDVLDNKKDIANCSYPVKTLFNKLDEEKLNSFRKYVENRDIVIESFLLMYIVNSSIYSYKASTLEKYYNQDELDSLSEVAINEVNIGIEDMYLEIRFENNFLK